jgi:hypothetical protein
MEEWLEIQAVSQIFMGTWKVLISLGVDLAEGAIVGLCRSSCGHVLVETNN